MAARKRPRARQARLGFEALSIEGGLLSPEWLSRVAQLAAGAQGEADFRIPKGLNLRDEIGRYWRIAQAHWADFATGRKANAEPKGLAERLVLGLLGESFGFASIAKVEPAVLSERSYPVGFSALSGRVPVVIAPADSGLDTLSPAFGDGGRRRSAFGLAQEFLNAEDAALWGLASDGCTLRILRDNASLTRPSWIEADLQRIFTEERYADFAALWLLVHETRFGREGQPVTECALEAWRNAGREEGTKAREKLRFGVEDALSALGQGFLAHPENQALRADLQSGVLSTKDYFNQLLRLVYRLIFLLTVEERNLLHPDGTSEAAKELYARGYGLRRLRERSVKRSAHDRFSDLWAATKIVFRGLAVGEPRLGLPALAGIFATSQCAALDGAKLENRALLLAVFKLAWLREDSSLARVNWRDMGPEELGSVYESLLELVPQIARDGRQFAFATGAETKGNARKTTGSYYTPDSLVQVLLDSALEPVIADTIARNPEKPVEALLGLSIVDPACGSGHFLLAAARRLAAHVARLQANGTPSAAEYRHALRQVVGRCIFGVDLNPMAVELCKVSLWMEAVEPGLPLTFLNSHIQHGNALLGTTPELMAKGIPDAAWEAIEGDDKKTASALKKRNKKAAEGQRTLETLWSKPSDTGAQAVARAVAELETASDANVEALAKKESQWDGILGSTDYRHQKFMADAWCAAFVWPKRPGELADAAPTNELWRQLRDGQGTPPAFTAQTVDELAEQYRFFHWHLQFSQVFAGGGFDVVLGNPPWERVKLQEQEFFASRSEDIAKAVNAAARKRLIAKLPEENPQLWEEWSTASRRAEGESHVIRNSGRFRLCGKGDVNTYAVFAEHDHALLGVAGRAGFIVPTGVATDDTTKEFFGHLMENQQLAAFYGFENEAKLFRGIDHRVNFCLLVLSRAPVKAPQFSAFVRHPEVLREPGRVYSLTAADIAVLNPNSRTCPVFRTRRDAELNLAMYRRAGVLWNEGLEECANPWNARFISMFHMANDSGLFRLRDSFQHSCAIREGASYIDWREWFMPLYEAKMVAHFNPRFGDFALLAPGEREHILPQVAEESLQNAHYFTTPRYWVRDIEVENRVRNSWSPRWFLGWRDVTDARSSVRTVVPCVIPFSAVSGKFPLIVSPRPDLALLYANLASFALDYAGRQKIGGVSLPMFVMKQFPVLGPAVFDQPTRWDSGSLREWFVPRILELTYTAWDLEPFARDVGYAGTPFRWDGDRRFQLRCELDAAFFHLYGFVRDDVDYVMETFPIVRKNDEKAHGEYRTKRVILDTYDALAKAAQTGRPYRTPLDPLPAASGASHGVFTAEGTPKDYAEALRTGLLFTLVRRSGDAGISQAALSRALLWLEDQRHAASWLEGTALADFERTRDADPLLAQGTSQAPKLLEALDNEKVITRDANGIVRLRAGRAIPNWLPQTPALSKLANVMSVGLQTAEAGTSATPAVDKVPTGKAKRA